MYFIFMQFIVKIHVTALFGKGLTKPILNHRHKVNFDPKWINRHDTNKQYVIIRQDIFNFIVIRKYPSNDPEKSVLECLCIVLTINKINISRIFLSACNVKINYEMLSDNYTRKSFTRRLIHIIFLCLS